MNDAGNKVIYSCVAFERQLQVKAEEFQTAPGWKYYFFAIHRYT